MKFAAIALASLASLVAADLPTCDNTKLIGAVAGADSVQCTKDSGYSPALGGFPTDAQFQVLCFDASCKAFLTTLKAGNPTECLIKGIFATDTPLYANLVTPIETECNKRNPTPAPTTPVPTTPTPTTPTPTTPAPTTPAPTTPAPTTPTPTVTPTPTTPDATTPAPTSPKPAC